ncbi:DgyrCDS2875 [Dimorphilus gyrociliatus]|uniref:DgyrCDS2875 n=1 Tax=Dimorphilus gyrociliatus TaxID=2664684 RepID=A0A7I8VE95_9ANNE|nr:DgyrCDS2875 [Dimorphilus gyrociliatus]
MATTPVLIFFGFVALFFILLVIFFLCLNKKLCFKNCGGFPCLEDRAAEKESLLEASFGEEARGSSGDESDEDVRQRFIELKRSSSVRASGQSVLCKKSANDQTKEGQDEPDHHSIPKSNDSSNKDSSILAKKDSASTRSSKVESNEYDNYGYSTEKDVDIESKVSSNEENMSIEGIDHELGQSADETIEDEHERQIISRCGQINATFIFEEDKKRVSVTIHNARDIPTKERGGANNTQVRLLLLPVKKGKCKTKIKEGENPEFEETFNFKMTADNLATHAIRVRLYGCERMRRERMIGESAIGLGHLKEVKNNSKTQTITLEPRMNINTEDGYDVGSLSLSDSASSTQSLQHGGMPELLLGLAYNETTGRLSVEAVKGSNFRNLASHRPPDTYVKFSLMSPTGREMSRSKTTVRRGQPNPLFKETFMFQVPLFQLQEVTLMVSVYNKRTMKRKDMIGWFSLGLNNLGEEELSHWNDMGESKGEQVCRWHVLSQT